jgi:hypothetical protein
MSPNEWGPQVWKLFHVLAESVHESDYHSIKETLLAHIKNICAYLPCPDCASHATDILNRLNPAQYNTKEGLINTMYLFHNTVNKTLNKPLFKKEDMTKYKTMHIIPVIKNFSIIYTQSTKGNMKLVNQNFHRGLILQNFTQWMNANMSKFLPM